MIIDLCDNQFRRGDLILVAMNNRLELGVYIKEGKSNNANYYILSEYAAKAILARERVYTSYINTNYKSRLAKYSEEFLTETQKIQYKIIVEYLIHG